MSYCFDIIRNAINSCEGVDGIPYFSIERILGRLSEMCLSSKVKSYSDTRIFLQAINLFSTKYYLQIALSPDSSEAFFVLNNHFFILPGEDAAIAVLESLYNDNLILEIQRRHAEQEKNRIKNERLARLKRIYMESKKNESLIIPDWRDL